MSREPEDLTLEELQAYARSRWRNSLRRANYHATKNRSTSTLKVGTVPVPTVRLPAGTPPFPNKHYKVVLADPPWAYYGDPNKNAAAGKHYDLLTVEQMALLPVRSLIDGDGALFMWATCPKLDDAVELLRRWGFHYRGVAYVWVKTTKEGKVISGQGVRPSFVKPTTELVLVGSTKRTGRSVKLLTEAQGQVFMAPRPGEHSKKPDEVHKRIDALVGSVPKLELFARESFSPEWDVWGNDPKVQAAMANQ